MNLSKKNELIKYLKSNNLWAKKSMGQNFLVNECVLDKIVDAAELKQSDTVLEIGPGLGVLTDKLIERAGKVITVEKDNELAKLLICKKQDTRNPFKGPLWGKSQISSKTREIHSKDPFGANNKQKNKLEIINADILDVDIEEILKHSPRLRRVEARVQDDSHVAQNDKADYKHRPETNQPMTEMPKSYKLIANIPYYITGQIFKKFLSVENKPETIVMLVQKEVAERIVAKPGKMTVLSVSVQIYGKPEIIDIVKARSFYPAPKVDSAIIKIRITNNELRITDEQKFFRCVKHGFSSKRKTLVNNLSSGYQIPKEKISEILEKCNFSQNTRAQELSVEDWIKLALEIDK